MQPTIKFTTIEPTILYFGTPVALVTTLDSEGKANIGPMSSVWALGWTFGYCICAAVLLGFTIATFDATRSGV